MSAFSSTPQSSVRSVGIPEATSGSARGLASSRWPRCSATSLRSPVVPASNMPRFSVSRPPRPVRRRSTRWWPSRCSASPVGLRRCANASAAAPAPVGSPAPTATNFPRCVAFPPTDSGADEGRVAATTAISAEVIGRCTSHGASGRYLPRSQSRRAHPEGGRCSLRDSAVRGQQGDQPYRARAQTQPATAAADRRAQYRPASPGLDRIRTGERWAPAAARGSIAER